ncbi:hypothetical protein [Vagococcus xieshaowenii]|uniref:Uncharacterized protein n=1 Tax=Vagococcus xieshaowenii TaxID=2562451 RepID=A0AAJ5EER9_9ENTE|nr:hypothetical protein [Vagococcus xieshaowenii]QCA29181.1 hypothetical protein E4Z98_07575 [Vagococcus xieshaowenii]TFZ40841.1 hypothetical protein E4031_05515 [Vagococcus xieshaowenii]
MGKNRISNKSVYQHYRSRYTKASQIAEIIETLLVVVAFAMFSNTTSDWLVLLNWVILPIFTVTTFILMILDFRGRIAAAKRDNFTQGTK